MQVTTLLTEHFDSIQKKAKYIKLQIQNVILDTASADTDKINDIIGEANRPYFSTIADESADTLSKEQLGLVLSRVSRFPGFL